MVPETVRAHYDAPSFGKRRRLGVYTVRTISFSDILYTISLFLVFNEVYMSSLSSRFIYTFSTTANMLIYALATLMFCILQLHFRDGNGVPIISTFFAILALIVLVGAIRNPQYLYADVKYMSMAVAMMFAPLSDRWLKPFFGLLVAFGLVFIITTIWFSLDRTYYYRYFAERMYPNQLYYNFHVLGRMSGITSHYSQNGIMLASVAAWMLTGIMGFSYDSRIGAKSLVPTCLVAIALVLCGKRAHFLFTVIAFLITYLLFNYGRRGSFSKLALIALLLISGYYMLLSMSQEFRLLIGRFSNLSDDSSMLIRYRMWEVSLAGFTREPLFGVGWLGARLLNMFVTGGAEWDSHNAYVQILCETGVLGGIFFSVAFVFSLIQSIRLVRLCSKSSADGHLIRYSLFSLAYQVYFLMYGITGSTMQTISVAGVYFVAFFIGTYYMYRVKQGRLALDRVPYGGSE